MRVRAIERERECVCEREIYRERGIRAKMFTLCFESLENVTVYLHKLQSLPTKHMRVHTGINKSHKKKNLALKIQ